MKTSDILFIEVSKGCYRVFVEHKMTTFFLEKEGKFYCGGAWFLGRTEEEGLLTLFEKQTRLTEAKKVVIDQVKQASEKGELHFVINLKGDIVTSGRYLCKKA